MEKYRITEAIKYFEKRLTQEPLFYGERPNIHTALVVLKHYESLISEIKKWEKRCEPAQMYDVAPPVKPNPLYGVAKIEIISEDQP